MALGQRVENFFDCKQEHAEYKDLQDFDSDRLLGVNQPWTPFLYQAFHFLEPNSEVIATTLNIINFTALIRSIGSFGLLTGAWLWAIVTGDFRRVNRNYLHGTALSASSSLI